MKRLLFVFIIILMTGSVLFSQDNNKETDIDKLKMEYTERSAISVGLFKGGGSLFGADFSTIAAGNIGFQLGAGLLGFGAGLNYYLEPDIRSSLLSVQYGHTGGTGDSFVFNYIEPSFIFRGNRWFTASIGIAFVLDFGPAFPKDADKFDSSLNFSIGAYFPI